MADSSHVDSNIVTDATDSTGATVIAVVQSNVTESSRVDSVITTGGKGDIGVPGPIGPQGIQGIQGLKGDTGAKGDKGDTGAPGTTDYNDLTNKPTIPDISGKADKTYVDSQDAALQTAIDTKQPVGDYATNTALSSGLATKADISSIPDITGKADITYVDAQDAAIASTAQSNLTAHTSDTANPHAVTKAQVGLGNVDNTSDTNKPVSTAQAAADATKVSKSDTASSLYGTDSSGGELLLSYTSATPASNTIVQRSGSGQIVTGAPTISSAATTKAYVDTADALKVNKAGDTMTGTLAVQTGTNNRPAQFQSTSTVSGNVYENASTSYSSAPQLTESYIMRNASNSAIEPYRIQIFTSGAAGSERGRVNFRTYANGSNSETFTLDGKDIYTYAGTTFGFNGATGPKYLTGSGFPNGVVSAPTGSIYIDTAVTNGASSWIKKIGTGNTGWQVLEGDTGWRNLGQVWAKIDENILLRRIGAVCYMTTSGDGLTINGTVINIQYNAPAGFAPSGRVELLIANNGAITARVLAKQASSALFLTTNVIGGYNAFANNSYLTDSNWPTTLPGTAL